MATKYIIKTLTTEGPVPAAELKLLPDGTVGIKVLRHANVTNELAGGVGSAKLRRNVLPSEGQVFIDAVKDELARSTYWSVESEDSQ